MKQILIKLYIGAGTLALLLTSGCNKVLKETPRSSFTPQYFQTANGVLGGLTALYAHLRYIYGNAYYWNMCQCGTDESTWGQSGGSGSNFQAQDYSVPGVHPTPTLSDAGQLWGNTFPYINTANGVIQYGVSAGVAASYIAEAKFFRAFDYFLLVQTFGGVPLDLGSGRLQFNTSTLRSSVRDSVSIVYTKAIFPDLNEAVSNLPSTRRVTGAVTKQVAQLFLAKAYLTYGWWLENPNSIPSYPVESGSPRKDPDGHDPAWYYQQAYTIAVNAIQNPGVYGLQPTYYDVNVATNDYNNECMLYSDHTQLSSQYNVSSFTYGAGGTPDNWSSWFQTWAYPSITSSTSAGAWSSVYSVQRASEQWGGRPWVRNAPTIEVFTKTFADKTNDSRYDGTFTSVYRCNMKEAALPYTTLYNANNLPVTEGAAVLTFLNDDVPGIDYSNAVYKSSVGAGVLPGRADYVIAPSAINRIVYPGLWKIGPYRTDNNGGLGNPNAGSTRPYTGAKFSELYFIAAEAAVKGATITAGYDALTLINVIRARAGKWKYSNAGRAAYVADNSAAMVAATPATITIGYILAERSREYYGEGYRFYDLVRTQRFGMDNQEGYNYGTYTIGGAAYSNHTPLTNTRTITPQLYLQPIPQGQIDAMQMSDAAKKAYQNPGY
ncbi:RagB/SusD family nutrient uptake outer membrane protein [Flavitalea sp. BT771]|uniref:RagB/SusD family nutrient uptake outer membrane protein n=1 Tax=Flavitalea sp. BT771 TaxID=3063329 RepID=UPI0026E32234|nr:RagB/SusD family nutrient uptake outer membrane protein [Flavitalea sp. BT771]MDO6434782.1 RagB/SusD family nutrient uptake outer membrane protein [Flavitalea sp. BT771]MDV6223682.1 RagB/SusD family nutrient uptake outer membrane protein [Flavitalea sp. BT771]